MILVIAFSFVTFLGACLSACEIVFLVKWQCSEKLKATVVRVEGNGRQGGIVTYWLNVSVGVGRSCQLPQKVRLSNPLKLIFPRWDVGKLVLVRYDRAKGRLIQHISLTLFYLVIGIFISLAGGYILYMLLTYF